MNCKKNDTYWVIGSPSYSLFLLYFFKTATDKTLHMAGAIQKKNIIMAFLEFSVDESDHLLNRTDIVSGTA